MAEMLDIIHFVCSIIGGLLLITMLLLLIEEIRRTGHGGK